MYSGSQRGASGRSIAGLFTLTDAPLAGDRDYIHQQIRAFNDATSEHHRAIRQAGPSSLDILARDDKGRLVGGLIARTYWGWLEIDDFWLDEALRGRGYGREWLRMAEEEARQRGCTRALLRTFSFQARGFYEKEGYRVVGQLQDYPPGETFYWMRKDIGTQEVCSNG